MKKIKLLLFAFTLFLFSGVSAQKQISFECFDCEKMDQKDCDVCKTGGVTNVYLNGLVVRFDNAAPVTLHKPFEVWTKGRTVYVQDWKGTKVSIPARKTVYNKLNDLVDAITACNCGEDVVDTNTTYVVGTPTTINGTTTYIITDSDGNEQTISFTDTNTQRTDAEICAAVAANCNAEISQISYSTNIDGDNVASFDFIDNSGNIVTRSIIFPSGGSDNGDFNITETTINGDENYNISHTQSDGTEKNFDILIQKYVRCDGSELQSGDKLWYAHNLSQEDGFGVIYNNDDSCPNSNDEFFDTSLSSYAGSYQDGSNRATGAWSRTANGRFNTTSGAYGFTGAGLSGNNSGQFGFLGSGRSNIQSASYGVLGGGRDNNQSGLYGFIGAGQNVTQSGSQGVYVGGFGNTNVGLRGFGGGGSNNQQLAGFGFIGSGDSNINDANATRSGIVSGNMNHNGLDGQSTNSFIGAGQWNATNANSSYIPGGENNYTYGLFSGAFGRFIITRAYGEQAFGTGNVLKTNQNASSLTETNFRFTVSSGTAAGSGKTSQEAGGSRRDIIAQLQNGKIKIMTIAPAADGVGNTNQTMENAAQLYGEDDVTPRANLHIQTVQTGSSGEISFGGVLLAPQTEAQRDGAFNRGYFNYPNTPAGQTVYGTTIYCEDCAANDGSIGVYQTITASGWKNHW